MAEQKKILKWRIAVFTLCIFILTGVFVLLACIPRHSPASARDARILTAIYYSQTVMTAVHDLDGNYDNFNCILNKDMVELCRDIDYHYGKEDGKEPLIVHDNMANSQAVCIYSPLNKAYGSKKSFWRKKQYWYCADSTWRIGFTEIDPGSPEYCAEGGDIVCPSLNKETTVK